MYKRAATYVIAGVVLLAPAVVAAQIVPCGHDEPCNACDLMRLADRLLDFIIQLSVFAAIIAFVYAGFIMVTAGGDEGKVTTAKSIFSSVAIGFIIVLAAWLIVNVIMASLTGQGLNFWSGILC